jgi:DNA polymerase-1
MLEAFRNDEDIHTRTASQIFGIPEENVTKSMRSVAKTVNFGIIYGMGAFSLGKDIGVTTAEAKKYIDRYFQRFPKVQEFMDGVLQKGRENGYVSTLFGRRREVLELTSSNKMVQAAGERIARNTPIQGTAADIIKIAMVKIYNRLSAENLDARLILQIHDELIVESSEKDAEKALKIVEEEMTNAYKLDIPLTVEGGIGKTWFDAKK